MLRKIPNILTIGRIIIVPFFVLAFYLPGFYGDLTALILFVVASFTDFLDGMLARMLGEESKLGELLDPIADKIIVATALILLVMDGTIRNYEVIAAIIILTREILISGLREFLAKGKIKLPVSNLAKLKTVLQMVSIAFLLSGETGNKIIEELEKARPNFSYISEEKGVKKNKDSIVQKLTGGIQALAKARKVNVINGYAKFISKKDFLDFSCGSLN